MKILGIVLGLMISVHAGHEIIHLCEGFVPQNDRSIPVAPKGFLQVGGITEAEFNDVLDRIQNKMSADVAEHGATLVVNRYWTSSEVNAYADRDGSNWLLEMHGGLARHPMMTADGYLMVACHELGHHIGGAPHYKWFTDGMSTEGQSDYYATLKCFRRMYSASENRAWAQNANIDPFIAKQCYLRYPHSESGELACIRAGMGGITLGKVLAELGHEKVPVAGQFDQRVVPASVETHPEAQCRLDTYFSGAICDRAPGAKVSGTDELAGVCEKVDGYSYGYRPRCWYKPAVADGAVGTPL